MLCPALGADSAAQKLPPLKFPLDLDLLSSLPGLLRAACGSGSGAEPGLDLGDRVRFGWDGRHHPAIYMGLVGRGAISSLPLPELGSSAARCGLLGGQLNQRLETTERVRPRGEVGSWGLLSAQELKKRGKTGL